jgi:hypothetical protein
LSAPGTPSLQRAAALAGLALALCAAVALAHRGHVVWTDIVWNGNGFEITHRMHLADAIAANRLMGGRDAIEAPRSLARVALYVEERFLVLAARGTPPGPPEARRLHTLGAEIENDFLFVYQHWQGPLSARFPPVDNSLLLDLEPDAQAFIRITAPGISEERERR